MDPTMMGLLSGGGAHIGTDFVGPGSSTAQQSAPGASASVSGSVSTGGSLVGIVILVALVAVSAVYIKTRGRQA